MKLISVVLICAIGLSGCAPVLSFGEDIELSGAEFDSTTLSKVSSLTGINFPQGSVGLNYYYMGSGIDDSLIAKIQIPTDKNDIFLQNEIFKSGKKVDALKYGNYDEKSWWNPSNLKEAIHIEADLNKTPFVDIAFGQEGGKRIAYVEWYTL